MGEGLVELVFIEKFSFPGTAVELGLHQVLAVLRSLEAGAEAGGTGWGWPATLRTTLEGELLVRR